MKSIEDKIKEIKGKEPEGKSPIYYKGETRDLPYYEVDLDLLRFNYLNGRIGSEALEHKQTTGNDLKNMNFRDANNVISKWIWNKDLNRNKLSLEDIREKGQIKPGVITRDGIIVDGNRRFMLLGNLREKYGISRKFKTIILDDTYEDGGDRELDIKRLETQLQIGEDEKVSYGPIEKYWTVINFKDDYDSVSDEEIAKWFKFKSVKEVNKLYEVGKLMKDYLEYIEMPNITSRLSKTEDLFLNLHKQLDLYKRQRGNANWDLSDEDIFQYMVAGFKLIRWNYNNNQDEKKFAAKDLREIYFSGSKEKAVINNKKVWDNFIETMDEVEDTNLTVEQVCKEKNISATEAAEYIDKKWAEDASGKIQEAVGRAQSKIIDRNRESEPEKFIIQALDKIDNLIDEDKFESENIIDINKSTLVSLLQEKYFEKNLQRLHKIRKISEALIKELKNHK